MYPPLCQKPQEFSSYNFGLAGSYSRGEESENSDIDIVVDTGNLTPEQMEKIKSFLKNKTVDILQMPLLKEEDELLDNFLMASGLPANNYSVYKTIKNEVNWI